MPEETRTSLGLSKVMTVTCTYDHRVIQGAESGLFLARLQALLEGEDGFYDRIFADLGIPMRPVRWEAGSGRGAGGQRRSAEAGGGRAADSSLARARASGRRHRSAGRRRAIRIRIWSRPRTASRFGIWIAPSTPGRLA